MVNVAVAGRYKTVPKALWRGRLGGDVWAYKMCHFNCASWHIPSRDWFILTMFATSIVCQLNPRRHKMTYFVI